MSNKTAITLDALLVIDTIQRQGSFAAAANALYRVPSALTYTIKKLEEDLGVTLFIKSGRQAKLTPAGEQLLADGRALLAAAEQLVENTKQVHSGWESKLRIAVDSIIDPDDVFSFIQRFQQGKPPTEIELFHEAQAGTWEALLQGRVDLLIGGPPYSQTLKHIHTQRLMDVDWVFCCAPQHPIAQQTQPLTEEMICQHLAIVVRDSSQQLPSMNSRLFDRQARLTVSSIDDKIRAQQAGIGIGFLPHHRIHHLLNQGELIELELEKPEESTALYFAWHEGHQGRALNWFTQALSQLAEGAFRH